MEEVGKTKQHRKVEDGTGTTHNKIFGSLHCRLILYDCAGITVTAKYIQNH